jgi:NADPH-dependent glutamate synthase beta subunit-like oxidoreductase
MVKKKVLRLANKITVESKTGLRIKPTDPEYRILEPVVTEEMAEVGLALKVRKSLPLEEVAGRCGKSPERTSQLLWDLADAGVVMIKTVDGTDGYWLPIWVPGIMEMMVGNKKNVEKYPVIAECFEEYTRQRTAIMAPNLPTGKGVMRVIPVEQAIMSESRAASYEEVSRLINENDMISVTNCSCRRSRRLMGEGCGHLEKDMCIQLGHGAEIYVRTGKARRITKEEAFDILRRAEENGLVHEITNVDGDGNAHAICNCCSCSCFSLRIAKLYNTPDMVRSNYVSHVDPEKCVACGQCVENCQMNALKLGQKLCAKTPLPEKKRDLPYDSVWGEDKWDPDYRNDREDVAESGTSPCKTECPAHIGIQGYIKLAAQGKYRDALELIKRENPFPAVCGRICPRKCESACTRGDVDDPVAIDEIKKFIAEQDMKQEHRFVPELRHHYGKKIAVIGAGPAGLSCAYFLAIDGYRVTVFEKQPVPGGMLTLGIPSFRLEKDVVHSEIDILEELGVTFRMETEVGKDISLEELRSQGYEAFYLAIGAQTGRSLGVEGEEAQGIVSGIAFLRNVNLGRPSGLKGRTLVIGGGNVAVDVARTAVRAGADTVDMFCLESQEEMPALEEETEEAAAEGITIHNSWGPKRMITENGRVTAVEFMKCVSVFDEAHRFRPKYDENNTVLADADNVLLSIGQSMDWGDLAKNSRLVINRNGTVQADPFTWQTGEPDVFAGGDVVTGPKFAIDAIAAGKEGAISIHRFVQPGQSLTIGRDRKRYHALDKDNIELGDYDSTRRQRPASVDHSKSRTTFRDLRGAFTEEQVKRETERCLGCGATVVDEYMCVGCGICTTKCKFDAVSLVKRYDAAGQPFEKLLPTLASGMVKRGARIAVKSAKNVIRRDPKRESRPMTANRKDTFRGNTGA